MSDWARGDLALCVRGGTWMRRHTGVIHSDGPKTGDILRVVSVLVNYGLQFSEYPNLCGPEFLRGFNPSRFRKIRPSAINHIEALKDVPLPVRENEHA